MSTVRRVVEMQGSLDRVLENKVFYFVRCDILQGRVDGGNGGGGVPGD